MEVLLSLPVLDKAPNVVHIFASSLAERVCCIIHSDIGPFLLCNWYRPPERGEVMSIDTLKDEYLLLKSDADGRSGHLSHYGQVDIALDPVPFNGATTTFEALLMGVPVVCLLGQQLLARSAASLITTAGLPELVGQGLDDYERIAISFATDHDRLSEIRCDMRKKIKASPLFDARRYARNVERFYRAMWHVWCAEKLQ